MGVLRGARAVGGALTVVAGVACGGGGGGGGGGDPRNPAVVSVRFVGANGAETSTIHPSFVPRNAWIEIRCSAAIDPASVHDPAVTVRAGPHFGSATTIGRFHVAGDRILFDPTGTDLGGVRPFGMNASTEHEIHLPVGSPSGDVLRSTGGAPMLSPFTMRFTTTEAWVSEQVPPRLLSVRFVPGASAGVVTASAVVSLTFDEPLDPASLRSSVASATPAAWDAFDVRYLSAAAENVAAGLAGAVVPVAVSLDPSATIVQLRPLFSLGDRPLVFDVSVLPGLRDLAGNPFSPGVNLGPFTCAGDGSTPPRLLAEGFDGSADAGSTGSGMSWAAGALKGIVATTRRVDIRCASHVNADAVAGVILGLPVNSPAPLIGADLDVVAPQVPAASLGRRVLLAFPASEIGAAGTVVGVGWGPDRNATFLATYPEVVIRLGHGHPGQVPDLPGTFAECYADGPVEVYRGSYSVAQAANVGNSGPVIGSYVNPPPPGLQTLFDHSGYVSYPPLAPVFAWEPGAHHESEDARTLILDVSARAGSTWQEVRGYFRGPPLFVGPPGGPVNGRRLLSAFEGSAADPQTAPLTPNPDPVVLDTTFTLVRHRAVAESRFYTPGPLDPAGNAYPGPHSAVRTLGLRSDYAAALLVAGPSGPPSGASVRIEYQGAMALDPESARTEPDVASPITPWTSDVDDCDGYPYLRWRLTLTTDVVTGAVPEIDAVIVPVRALP